MAFGVTPVDANNIPIGSTYVPGTGLKVLRGAKVITDSPGTNDSAAAAFSPEDGWKATYSASIVGLVPGATPQDIFTLTGSATKTVKVTNLRLSGLATAATPIDVVVLKRSTADTAGTSTTPTVVPYDSNNGAVSASVKAYTANPTAGTLVGNLHAAHLTLGIKTAATTDIGTDRLVLDYGDRPAQAPTLRGTGEVLAVNLNGIVAISGWVFDIWIEWTEE